MRLARRFILVLSLLITAIAIPVHADDATVSVCDFASLSAAVTLANSGGGTIDFDCSGTISFSSTLTITSDVIINENIFAVIFDGELAQRLFIVSSGASLTLNGFTLQEGLADNGGAVYNSGTLSANGTTFYNNTVSGRGAAIYNNAGTLNLTNSILNNNGASFDGGAIFNLGTATITSSSLGSNLTNTNGGAIASEGSLTLTSVIFNANVANGLNGGAVYNSGTATITDSEFMGNEAINNGGAIANDGTLDITTSTLSDNIADYGGVIFNDSGGVVTITTTILSDNDSIYGGAILNSSGATLTVSDSTVSGNVAVFGGGIYNNNGTVTLTNSIFSNNVGSFVGGAINNFGTVNSQGTYYENNTCVDNITDNGGNIALNSAGCPGSAVTTPPVIPVIPVVTSASSATVLGCALDSADGVEVAGAPDNTYCRVLMKNGGVVSYSGAVPAELIGLGVILAVDVYRLEGGATQNIFSDYARICLSGVGRYFYMDGRNAPRVSVEMPTETENGLTCAWIPAPGTVILTN